MRGRTGALAALLTATLALWTLATGCERRSQEAPAAADPAARLVATAGYGAEPLLSTRVAPDRSLLRTLRGATEVDTGFGGGFVTGMLGHESDAGAQSDWFFYVNGVSPSSGAREVTLRDGDDAWWDYRRWGDLMDAAAVVGAWPLPLARADGSGPEVAADPPLDRALADAGANLAAGDTPWRALVGSSDALAERSPAWRRALDDPDAAGLTVAIEDGAVTALAADGGPREPVPGARALVAAVPTGADRAAGVTVVVAGLDDAAARAAAEAVAGDPAILERRYALALDGEGTPLRAGGRAGP